jgi:uncharacterized protein YoxC
MANDSHQSPTGGQSPPLSEEKSTSTMAPGQFVACGAAISTGQMEKFVESFQQSAWRWEAVVYPALFAFVVLAGYGFFLIYSLTSDMSTMAHSMDDQMGEHMASMTENISQLATQISVMSMQVQIMAGTMQDISTKLDTLPPMLQYIGTMDHSMMNMNDSMTQMKQSVTHMDKSIGSMDKSINIMGKSMRSMDESMLVIVATTDRMQRDLGFMNRNMSDISRPVSFATGFLPW